MIEHGVEYNQQFAHGRDQRHLFRLTSCQQPLIEVADDGIVTGRGQGPHVENTPNPGASAPDGASASQGTAVPVEGRHAHQGRDLPSVQSAQLGQVGQQGERAAPPRRERCAEGRPSRAILDLGEETAVTPCPSRSTPAPTRRCGIRCGDAPRDEQRRRSEP